VTISLGNTGLYGTQHCLNHTDIGEPDCRGTTVLMFQWENKLKKMKIIEKLDNLMQIIFHRNL
jgi:hypothetical protein